MIVDHQSLDADAALQSESLLGFGIAWGVFWILLTGVAVQDYQRQGGTEFWKPLLWEGSSLAVATVVVALRWRRVRSLDAVLTQPWRWFLANLSWLPLIAPLFVAAVYTLRHAIYALLRAATDLARQPETTLDEEFRLLDAYADIMRQRFEDRVRLRVEVEENVRTCRLPSLIMQPLLENAFRHGVELHSKPTNIRVRAYQNAGRLRLEVQDDSGELPASPVLGVGLTNLQQRLLALYGPRASLALSTATGGGVLARIEMPCEY